MLVVFIHGPVASGKHTIGACLSEATGLPLFHNHLTVDLVMTLFSFGTKPFIKLRAGLWRAAFLEAAEAGQSFIFTFTPEATVDPGLVAELCEIIQDSGGHVRFVELTCSRAEILNRLPNADRSNKLNDRRLYEQAERDRGFEFPPMPRASISLDTEALSPVESVAAILGKVPGLARTESTPP